MAADAEQIAEDRSLSDKERLVSAIHIAKEKHITIEYVVDGVVHGRIKPDGSLQPVSSQAWMAALKGATEGIRRNRKGAK